MQFIRRKLSLPISFALLVLFFGIGLIESLHHHVSDETTISVQKDSNSVSLHKYQKNCEICTGISNHQYQQFDIVEVPVKLNYTEPRSVQYWTYNEKVISNNCYSFVNKGPPSQA
ncbi:hypothetical protein [Pedobacter aquatilis]|uniref:hypothetical protein n=1 Tax=Pedobacter aquatilis TaxID=351343 RepID=UPI002930015D|nr:hypothetical protein [Pedobacter aquatilis]